MRRDALCFSVVFGILLAVALVIMIPLVAIYGRSGALYTSVNVESVRSHLEQFQSIANANGGNRDPLKGGFNASLAYVAQRLVGLGYAPVQQSFSYGYFEVVTPPVLTVAGVTLPSVAVSNLAYSASASVTAALASAGAGCDAAAFAGTAGKVVLVADSAACTTAVRVQLAVDAGALAVVIVATGARSLALVGGALPGPSLAAVPLLRVTALFGQALLTGNLGATASIVTSNRVVVARSANLIAETAGGNANSVVVVGAHLDSVAAGPGINDNGSGSAVILTIATEMAKLQLTDPVNKVRFIWFGGEEKGLLGSQFYVNSLTPDQTFQLAMMLNFDMMGSPNYMIGVYDGKSYNAGSGVIQSAMESFASANGIQHTTTPFTGRSDYGPFLPLCPAGGLFTGAEEIKGTADAQVDRFGGMVNVPFDPCYHQACDTIDNIAWDALQDTTTIAAYAVQHFAYQQSLREYLMNE